MRKKIHKQSIFLYLVFNIKWWLNISISCLVYSHIWQNLPRDDSQFFYIFLWIITTLVTNKNPLRKPLLNINIWNKELFWGGAGGWQKGHRQRTCDKVVVNGQYKMCKNCLMLLSTSCKITTTHRAKPLNAIMSLTTTPPLPPLLPSLLIFLSSHLLCLNQNHHHMVILYKIIIPNMIVE